nr:helix-turn-helix domain-containing protein [Clostridium paraputrificum]
MNENELITRAEAKKILKVGDNRMLELLHRREFSFKIGNKWYVNKSKLLEWMDKQIVS